MSNPTDILQVSIPNMNLGKITCTGSQENADQRCDVPWLGNYIAGIYKYLLGIGALLATIMMMFGGFRWVVSAGNPQSISDAKAWIGGSVVGLIILFTSWIILYEVNPDLTKLRPINVSILSEQDVDDTEPVAETSAPSGWITIPGHAKIKYDPGVTKTSQAASVNKLIEVADSECIKNAGIKLRISDTSRTVDQQKALYDQNCPGNGGKCGAKCTVPTCCPYRSGFTCPHNLGVAYDIHPSPQTKDTVYKLQSCMQASGFCLLSSEFWHFEYPGKSSNCKGGDSHNLGHYKGDKP